MNFIKKLLNVLSLGLLFKPEKTDRQKVEEFVQNYNYDLEEKEDGTLYVKKMTNDERYHLQRTVARTMFEVTGAMLPFEIDAYGRIVLYDDSPV